MSIMQVSDYCPPNAASYRHALLNPQVTYGPKYEEIMNFSKFSSCVLPVLNEGNGNEARSYKIGSCCARCNRVQELFLSRQNGLSKAEKQLVEEKIQCTDSTLYLIERQAMLIESKVVEEYGDSKLSSSFDSKLKEVEKSLDGLEKLLKR